MRLQRTASVVLCALAAAISWKAQAQVKPRVAVFPFDDRTTANKDMNIGTKVADLLISKLTANGAFTVFDRQYVDKILAESHLKYDPNYDSASAAKAGLLGTVDLVVAGQIDAYNAAPTVSNSDIVFGKIHQIDGAVNLKVTVRLISVEKGSISSAPSAANDQKAPICKDMVIRGHGTGNCPKTEDQERMMDDHVLRGLVDKATEEVAKQLSAEIAPLAASITPVVGPPPSAPKPDLAGTTNNAPKPAVVTVNALFLGISEGLVYIDKGSTAGVKVGDRFTIRRSITKPFNDANGKPVVVHKTVCTAVIDTVEETSAAGKCVAESKGPDTVPHKGDEALLSSNSPTSSK
jgi:curli biogenesis system outer membrane secretion channel CsgG